MQGPAPTYENMSAEELDALLSDMEPDVRAADRDMREIELLEQKVVLSAGKLAGTRAFRVYLVPDVLTRRVFAQTMRHCNRDCMRCSQRRSKT